METTPAGDTEPAEHFHHTGPSNCLSSLISPNNFKFHQLLLLTHSRSEIFACSGCCCSSLHIYEPCVIMSCFISPHPDCLSAPAASCCFPFITWWRRKGRRRSEPESSSFFPFHGLERCRWRTWTVLFNKILQIRPKVVNLM